MSHKYTVHINLKKTRAISSLHTYTTSPDVVFMGCFYVAEFLKFLVFKHRGMRHSAGGGRRGRRAPARAPAQRPAGGPAAPAPGDGAGGQ